MSECMENKSQRAGLKAQLASIDMVIAVFMFAIIMSFAVSLRNSAVEGEALEIEKRMLAQEGMAAVDTLLRTSGNPYNWSSDTENITQLGLAKHRSHVLESQKIVELAEIDYELGKELLGVSREYFLLVEDLDGNRLYQAGNETMNGRQAVATTRFALLDGKPVKIELIAHGWD